jgi:hypothetical protein
MTQLKDKRPGYHARLRRTIAILLASLTLLIGVPWHSTAKLEPAPAAAVGSDPAASTATFAPFLNVVPSEDGRELYVSASGAGEVGGTAFVNFDIGPGHDKHSYTMVYSDTLQAYVATAVGFTPHESAYGTLNITTTLGLDTGAVDFNRAYVPASTVQTLSSLDGNLALTLVSTDTVTFDTYAAITPSYAPPGPAPTGHRFVGSSYSVRAAGALVLTDKPMSLRLYYNDASLTGADPHTLAIFAWDAYNERWENLGGRLFYSQQYLSVATSRFTSYALMATPAWRDDFDDFSGLNFPAEVGNVTLSPQGDGWKLVLSGGAMTGTAASKPITPTAAIASWGTLTFTGTMDSPTTTLSVDVLSMEGTEVLTDVVSGTSLAALDQYSVLKLRANLSSTVAGETPLLDRWQVTWQAEEHVAYLPLVVRQNEISALR